VPRAYGEKRFYRPAYAAIVFFTAAIVFFTAYGEKKGPFGSNFLNPVVHRIRVSLRLRMGKVECVHRVQHLESDGFLLL
jgi:hypothetical protein